MGNDTLYEYEQVLMGKQKIFLISFSERTPDRTKAFITVWRYAILDILKWTPEDALVNLNRELIEKLKLDRTLKCVGMNLKGKLDIREILSIVFPGQISNDIRDRTREEYERVLHIGRWRYKEDSEIGRFHKGYFSDENGSVRAAVCLNYAVSLYMGDRSINERYHIFADSKKANRFLEEAKLSAVMRCFYKTPLEFFHYSLPKDEKNTATFTDLVIRNAVRKMPAKDIAVISTDKPDIPPQKEKDRVAVMDSDIKNAVKELPADDTK